MSQLVVQLASLMEEYWVVGSRMRQDHKRSTEIKILLTDFLTITHLTVSLITL